MQTQSESISTFSPSRSIISRPAASRWLPLRRLLTGMVVGFFTSAAALAQTGYFAMVDQTEGELRDVTVAPNGTLLAVGTKYFDGLDVGVVRVSADRGASWLERVPDNEVVRYMSVMAGRRLITPATATEPAAFEDCIVIAGQANAGRWKVLRSINSGMDWELIEDFSDIHSSVYSSPELFCATMDSEGNVYLGGTGLEQVLVTTRKGSTTQLRPVWLVRRIGRDGINQTYRVSGTGPSYTCAPYGMTCVGTTLYAAGIGEDHWQVRRSDDGAKSWTLIDSAGMETSNAFAIAAAPDGSIYVVGRQYRVITSSVKGKTTTALAPYWIARKGTGMAGSFSTIAAISNENLNGDAGGVTVDSNGNVHITGAAGSDWVTKRLDVSTQQWTTSDRLPGSGWLIKSDLFGNVYSGGGANDGWGWTIRGPQPTPAEVPVAE